MNEIKSKLNRYFKILEGKELARFQICKKIECEKDSNLIKQHKEKIKEFYELLNDEKVKKLNNANYSFLDLKIDIAKKILKKCVFCEWKCKVNRYKNFGICKVGKDMLISSEFLHYGEEYFFVPSHTIFFMGCNFKCQFCQNYSISQWLEKGIKINEKELAASIEIKNSKNVNFVGGEPTPYLYHILKTLKHVNKNVPVIWNSNFYCSKITMQLLIGVVDVYLPDFKYGNDECALKYSKVKNYFKIVARNHLLAAKDAEIVVRHLILPNHVECCSKKVLDWIAKNIKDKAIVNIMDQYYPCYLAFKYPEINRRITIEEFEEVLNYAKSLGLTFIY